jgi:large subunit ribosomal protein L23
MALLDFLKRKKQVEKSKSGRGLKGATPKISDTKKSAKADHPETQPEKIESKKMFASRSKKGKFSYDAIKKPHISERATYLSEKNQYVFDVLPGQNKKEIKNSVEGIYGVNVLSVNIIKIPAKKRRIGRTEGFRKAYIKAVVRIKEGQKIEIL